MENTSILVSMLRQGKNGEEILQILDTIAASDDTMKPTSEPIDF
jgi:hypothetical protein